MRDITLNDTFYHMFSTRAFATGVPGTLGGVPVLSVLEENNATPITTDVTVLVDRASVTGLNQAKIIATTANGYEAGKTYAIYISTGTVDGVSVVGEVVGQFTIAASAAAVDLANGTDGLGAIKAETALILVDTGTTLDGKIDTIDANVDLILVDTGTTLDNHLTDIKGTSFVKDTHSLIDIKTETALIVADTNELQGDWTNTGRLDTILDSILTDTNNIVTDTADMQPKLGTIIDLGGGTTIGQNLSDMAGATFATGTDSLEAIRNQGDAAWTTGAGGSDRLLMVDTTIATLASQTSFTLTAGSADNSAYVNCTIVIEDAATATQKAVGLISAYTGSTKTVTLKYDPAIFTMATTDKVYILAENSLKSTDQNRQLDVTATGAAGIDWANVENPTTALDLSATDIQLCDTVTTTTNNSDMRGTDSAALASVCTEVRLAELGSTNLPADIDNILADTGTTLDNHLTDIKGTSFIKDTHSLIDIKTETALIVADTNELQGDWTNTGRLDTILDSVLTDTTAIEIDTQDLQTQIGTAGAGLSDLGGMSTGMQAEIEAEVNDALDTAISELGVAAPTATPTLRTALMLLYMALRNKTVVQTSGTDALEINNDAGTIIAKKLLTDDGSDYTEAEMTSG